MGSAMAAHPRQPLSVLCTCVLLEFYREGSIKCKSSPSEIWSFCLSRGKLLDPLQHILFSSLVLMGSGRTGQTPQIWVPERTGFPVQAAASCPTPDNPCQHPLVAPSPPSLHHFLDAPACGSHSHGKVGGSFSGWDGTGRPRLSELAVWACWCVDIDLTTVWFPW